MEFERKKMVNWYDPKQLAFTAVKTVISGIFGNFADRRETQAALDPDLEPYDYSDKPELWIDYISDLGDGFNPTYTMAHLMAQEHLMVDGKKITRGDVLVMGGDQVYPTPELKEYNNRLKGPYNAAFPWKDGDQARPSLFALPGNHDWYDGLTNFLRLFCQNRSLGNWHSKQSRSYFALKLPHNYWLLGIDVQLNADIDYPQLCYFRKIAEKKFLSKDKIILCTAEPSWVYKSFDKKNNSHDRINFFIDQVLFGKDKDYYEKNKEIRITAILTGDLHHYSRYEEIDSKMQKCQLITAGGGGAFMHPTHTLKPNITPVEGYSAKLENVFPKANASRALSLNNIIFPYYSVSMILFFGVLHLFTTWILQVWSPIGINFLDQMSNLDLSNGQLPEILDLIIKSIQVNPSVLALNLLLFGGILLFTDTSSGNGKWNYIAGAVHGVLHLINLYFFIWIFSRLNLQNFEMEVSSWKQILLFSGEMILFGGIASAILFGIYLLVSISLLNNHITEASSSFRWEGYKNFLRIHLTKEGVTIYPIGVKKVVKNWKNVGTDENPKFEGGPINYSLIEEPIKIDHEKAV
jgi:hypothetical protein